MPTPYHFTQHARERFKDRFPGIVHAYKGNTPLAMSKEIMKAKETKAHINNTAFIVRQQEKYGWNQQLTYLVNESAVFLVGNNNILITVFPLQGSLFEGRQSRFKRK